MILKDLVGFQLVSINDDEMIVKKDGLSHRLTFHRDEGDCCGFTELETKLLISEDEAHRNPVITDIYINEHDGEWGDGNTVRVTFFGEYLPLANVYSYASSGSGWCYGAAVSVECNALNLHEELASW